jgi:hypothetical protein
LLFDTPTPATIVKDDAETVSTLSSTGDNSDEAAPRETD